MNPYGIVEDDYQFETNGDGPTHEPIEIDLTRPDSPDVVFVGETQGTWSRKDKIAELKEALAKEKMMRKAAEKKSAESAAKIEELHALLRRKDAEMAQTILGHQTDTNVLMQIIRKANDAIYNEYNRAEHLFREKTAAENNVMRCLDQLRNVKYEDMISQRKRILVEQLVREGRLDVFLNERGEVVELPITGGEENIPRKICEVCCRKYEHEGDLVPRILACGHTYCEHCIKQIAIAQSILCPHCRQKTKKKLLSDEPIEKSLTKNYALLQ